MEGDGRSPGKLCDMCGQEVADDEAVSSEMTVGDVMCPTPMVLHPACHERASEMWHVDADSYCTVDPEFPETQQWPVAQGPQD